MSTPEWMDVLTWRVGKRLCAIELTKCRHVMRNIRVQPVPHSREFFSGICNVWGEVVLVVNMALLLGESGREEDCPYLVCLKGVLSCGLRVDAVDEVRRFEVSSLRPLPSNLDEKFLNLARGAFFAEGDWIYLIDPENIFK